MKFLVFGAVFCFAFVLVVGAPNSTFEEEVKKKEKEATTYCNALHPVTEDPRKKLALTVIRGDPLPKNLSTIEWCNLQCVLEKLGFYDAEGKMQVRKIYQFVAKILPGIANNNHYFLMMTQQTNRMIKGMEDKCMKGYVTYYRLVESIITATLAEDLNSKPEVKEKVMQSVLSGESISAESEANIENYFRNTEKVILLTVGGFSEDDITTPSPTTPSTPTPAR